MQLPLLLSRYGDGTKKAQFGTHVLSELSFGFLCVQRHLREQKLSQRVSSAFKSLSEKVYHSV